MTVQNFSLKEAIKGNILVIENHFDYFSERYFTNSE